VKLSRLAPVLMLLPALQAAVPSVSDTFYEVIRADDTTKLAALVAKGVDVNTRDERGATPLMYAAAAGSAQMMRQLIMAGADVNGKNNFDATALMWCANDLEKVRLLTEKGADVNARSKRGRTPLLIAAAYDGNSTVLQLLLDKGADLAKAIGKANSTPLLEAAAANDMASIKLLLQKGADFNAKNAGEFTVLMYAAGHGNVELVKWLISHGADVNAQSAPSLGQPVRHGPIALGRLTPLMLGVMSGNAETVRLLLEAGANVNAQDVRGMTPLMFAVATDHPNDVSIRTLLAKRPAIDVKSNANETAFEWSAKFQNPSIMTAIREALPAIETVNGKTADAPPDNTNDVQKASAKGIALLQRTTGTFFKESGCVSCHAHNITTVATAAARRKDVRFDEPAAAEMVRATRMQFGVLGEGMLERLDLPVVDIVTYSLFALANAGVEPNRITDMMVHNIAAQQHTDGSWGSLAVARPPMADGRLSVEAMAIRGLKQYAPPARKAEMDERVRKAANWLLKAEPHTTEDSVMQLLGAAWACTDRTTLEKLGQKLLALQSEDGGWAQTPFLKSDAYATGTALYALSEAGLITSAHPAYKHGVDYLLKTQAPDGSWHVASRAPKFQPYFESGFPYGHDQWISQMATGWATIAVTNALP
jgi:ankyrin repeat protein